MREQLVSYLLGELEAAEAADVETRLQSDPKLREQLDKLRECLPCDTSVGEESAELAGPCEPPSGLADRTADSVHDLILGLASTPAANAATGEDAPRCSHSFTLVDAGVAAGVILALGMMLLPALQESREASRRNACQYNLAKIGKALQQYAEDHGGLLPHVHAGENAGVYSVRVTDKGYLDRRQAANMVVCRSSPLGQQIADGTVVMIIPSADQLKELNANALAIARRLMGGSYAYRLGYLDGPLYQPIRFTGNSRSPMLSDAPNPQTGRWQSINHGGCGQNVLFQDGSVRYERDCLLREDNLFVNAAGEPAAGRGWDDAVLVGSDRTPGVLSTPGQTRRFRATLWRITPR
ncbi:MAG: DUF1559 domain-containing protein [Planctomycetota bacterium]